MFMFHNGGYPSSGLLAGGRLALSAIAIVASSPSNAQTSPAVGLEPNVASGVAAVKPPTKEQIVEAAAEVVRSSDRLSRIWPGYWPKDQAFIIQMRGEGALLVTKGEPPEGFEPVPDERLLRELRGRVFYHEGTLREANRPFVIGFPIGGARRAILINTDGRELSEQIGMMLHEQFHGYQAMAFKRGGSQFVDPLAIKDRVAFAAAADVERRLLAEALTAGSKLHQKKILKSYFAMRREREATVPAAVKAVEQGFERSEGTATYVTAIAKAVLAKDAAPAATAKRALAGDLTTKLGDGPFMTIWFRSRSYSTGAALAALLDQHSGGDWKSQVAAGKKLDELLERAIGGEPEASTTVALADRARLEFGYEQRRRELEPLIRAAEKAEIKSVQEFLALAPYQLVLQSSPQTDQRPGFSARNMTPLGPAIMALPVADRLSIEDPLLSLNVEQKPVLLEGDVSRTTVLLKALPTIEGLGRLNLGVHSFDRIKIKADGLILAVNTPVSVLVEVDRMVVRVNHSGD